MADTDRRGETRLDCDLESVIVLTDETRIPTRAIDISYSGICVESVTSVPRGTLVTFELRISTPSGSSETLELSGETMWCAPVRCVYQIGARFAVDMNQSKWHALGVIIGILRGEILPPHMSNDVPNPT